MKNAVMYHKGERYNIFYTRDVYGEVVIHRIEHCKSKQLVKNGGENWEDFLKKAHHRIKRGR